jgi:drug/metabolite transporter (DMT)-like permease
MTTDTVGRHEAQRIAAGLGDWLCLAAAPTFAIMAVMTGALGGGHPHMLCSTAQDASPLGGMAPMYLLMSAFHSTPWLTLISRRRRDAGQSL